MIKVVPAILAKTSEEFEMLIKKVEPYVDRVHLDIADGVFVPNKTITGYEELIKTSTHLKFDVHLMVARPEDQMYQWYKTGADRFIIHLETDHGHQDLIKQIHTNDRKIGLAINPETNPDELFEFIDLVDFIQFMTVQPGFYGGDFIESVVNKIAEFHGQYPRVPIVVDGGINPQNGQKVVTAGASILVSGSYIFESQDVGKVIEELRAIGHNN